MKLGLSIIILLSLLAPLEAGTFRVASYNVQNLFDLTQAGTEYREYIPNAGYGWNIKTFEIKVANIATVIKDLHADIVALQEIESKKALTALRKRLKDSGVDYPYFEIARFRGGAIRCAILSKFPIIQKKELRIGGKFTRNILEMTLDINGTPLVLFVNHWKSKRGPESLRIAYAERLKDEIDRLKEDTDFILVGDFNSNYNEYETFVRSRRLNNTAGITGINHVLKTVKDSRMVSEAILTKQAENEYLYNLWLELENTRRWSYNFFGDRNSPDSIILSRGLYDDKGISYIDNSFDRFDPDYLFKGNTIYRWQKTKGGKGKHLGKGYSDHLPVFADFSTDPFYFSADNPVASGAVSSAVRETSIAALYTSRVGSVNYHLKDCAVIYRNGNNAVIKQKNGRAVFIYKVGADLEYGKIYNLAVTMLYDYYGLREITGIGDIRQTGEAVDLAPYMFGKTSADLSGPDLQSEVISEIKGVYRRGYLYYGDNRKIKLYFKNKRMKPENGSIVSLEHVRIGYHQHPELLIEKTGQIRIIRQ
ncbi:MAG: endonuclease/exonuclease/phosphatase family protein [Nitrospirota bacterium]|nr:endonuclease/exonuclease/phosphatase family protein [Nitrospirota bacterium]